MFGSIKKFFFGEAQVKQTNEPQCGYRSRSGFSGEKYDGALNYDTAWNVNRASLIRRSSKIYHESLQARAAIERLNDSVINTGLALESTPVMSILGISKEDRKKVSDQIETSFNLWAKSKSCDKSGHNTLSQMKRILFNTQLVKGDYFALLEYSRRPDFINPFQVRIISPQRVSTPYGGRQREIAEKKGHRIVEGVELDQNDAQVAIYIKSKKKGIVEWVRVPKYGPVTGRQMYVHGNRQRFVSEVRGIPALSAVAHELEKITDYSIYELQAAIANAVIAMTVTPGEAGPSMNPLPSNAFVPPNMIKSGNGWVDGEESGLDSGYTNIGKQTLFNSGGLLISGLNPGEKVESHDTKRPNVNFSAFLDGMTKYISASLSIPIEVLNMTFGNNFSASRASLKLFWQSIDVWRDEFVSDFLNPVYQGWLLGEVGTGRLVLRGFETPYLRSAWQSASWTGIGSPSIDPVKESKAAENRNKSGHATRAQEAKKYNGSDFDSNISRLEEENKLLGAANDPLEKVA